MSRSLVLPSYIHIHTLPPDMSSLPYGRRWLDNPPPPPKPLIYRRACVLFTSVVGFLSRPPSSPRPLVSRSALFDLCCLNIISFFFSPLSHPPVPFLPYSKRCEREVCCVTWHGKGDYLASVSRGESRRAVMIHQVSKASTQCPFRKTKVGK